jgi:hypothetical protein
MKKMFVLVTYAVCLILAACQSTNPLPAQQPGKTLPAITSPVSTSSSQPTITQLPTSTPLPAATPLPAPADIKPVYITAFCTLIGKDAKTYLPQGTPIIITWGWEAKTVKQIDDFLLNNITTITLDGKVIEGIYSEGIKKNEKSGQPEVVWYAKVGVLNAGQHIITYDVKFLKIIDDGTSTYGPGSKNETEHDECQVIVE